MTEFKFERDRNLFNGEDLCRIRYRKDGDRKWSSVVVVLDEETTYETVVENAGTIISLYSSNGHLDESEET